MKQPNRHWKMPLSVCLVMHLAIGVAAGCKGDGQGSSAAAPSAVRPIVTAPATAPLPTGATRLKVGPAPLTYMFGPGGPIHFIDVETGKTVARTTAPQQAIIGIDEAKGISVANTIIKTGPLPAGHHYELWWIRP